MDSLQQRLNMIRSAFYNATRPSPPAVAESREDDFWVKDIFDDFLLIEDETVRKFYKVPYTVGDDGVTIAARSEWTEMEQVWQAKSMQALKAVQSKPGDPEGSLRVGNYIALWGSPQQRDLEGIGSSKKNADGSIGEFFTPKTVFESDYTKTGQIYLDFEHGRQPDGIGPGRNDILGYVDWKSTKKDDVGLWAERVLTRRDQYTQFLGTLIEAGLVGSSSEAVPGQVEKAKNGEIQQFPLMRDSLTVMPMEPRMITENTMQAIKGLREVWPELKALAEAPGEGADQSRVTGKKAARTTIQIISSEEGDDMTPEEVKALQDEMKSMKSDLSEIKGSLSGGNSEKLDKVLKFIENSPALKDGGYVAPDSEGDHADSKSFGDFLIAVKHKNTERIEKVYGATSAQKALGEASGEEGGYTVPEEFRNNLLEVQGEMAVVEPHAFPIPMGTNITNIPALDQTGTSSAQSNFLGGLVAGFVDEAGSLPEADVKFRNVKLEAHKLAGYTLVSRELEADSAIALEAFLTRLFGEAIAWHRDYNFLRGNGAGVPMGILNAAATIAVSRNTGSHFKLPDAATILSKMIATGLRSGRWYMSQTVIPDLLQMVDAGSNNIWIANVQNMAEWRLFGLPIDFTEKLPALGTAGDVILADPRYYLVGNRGGLTIASSEHYKFTNDQVTWKFTDRVDGKPWLNSSITLADGTTKVSPFVKLS